jgi:tRNA-specific 2-thiouridylase
MQVRHSEFLARHLGEWPGPIIEQETGEVLGFHCGFWFHTVGQRRGVSGAVTSPIEPVSY